MDPDEGNPERSETEEALSFSFCNHLKYQLPEDTVNNILLELEFLRMFLRYTANRCSEYQDLGHLRMRAEAVERRAENFYLSSEHANCLYNLAAHVEDELKLMRPEIVQVYKIVSSRSSLSHTMSNGLVIDFVDSALENLKYLLRFKVKLDDRLGICLKVLNEKLLFLRYFLMFAEKSCTQSEELNHLFSHAQFAADHAAHLSYSCLIHDMDQQMLIRLVSDLSSLVQKIDPLTPKAQQIYIAVLKVSSELSSRPDLNTSKSDDIAVDFLGSVLELVMELLTYSTRLSSIITPLKDKIDILQLEIILLKSFLMDLPNLNIETQTSSDLLTESKFISLMGGSVVYSLNYRHRQYKPLEEVEFLVDDFLQRIKLFKVKITKIYPKEPFHKFPGTDELRILDRFLGNLRELPENRIGLIQGLKLEVQQLGKDLEFFRSFLSKISKQHNEQEKQLKVLWTQIVNVAYKAEYTIDLLLVRNGSEEYHRFQLSKIRKEIEALKAEVNKIDKKEMHNSEVNLGADISSQAPLRATSLEIDEVVVGFEDVEKDIIEDAPLGATSLEIDEVVVGFEDVEKNIIEDLMTGSTKQQTIAIVGMPGQGKTHLAKKIYNNPIVEHYFHIRASCYVSQVYDRNHLLTRILSQVMESPKRMNEVTNENLDEVLYKRLKGNRYLILMDDLWEVEAWDALRRSFPDDNNGSRIIFTSRFHNLDLKASGSKIHRLRPFSDNESWQLLQGKLFQSESCPSELREVGKQIAKNCKGLPLAVVVITGVLARIDMKEHCWREVANSQSSYIVDDPEKQPMKVIDLSYKHLPGYLKPCFLYIGAFIDNNYIPVQKLIGLWVAEGFIHKVEEKSLENIAEDYLMDLIDRSLIIIAKRRSTGDIKVCSVHDLVRDFCLKKAEEDNFLQLIKRKRTSHLSPPLIFEQLRISSNRPELFLASNTYCPYVRSLLLFGISGPSYGAGLSVVEFMCHKLKLVGVLDLESIEICDGFPDEINSLGHLRYLAISGHFDSIPSSVANLCKLEIFILKGSRKCYLPRTIWNMRKLRHLHISPCAFHRGPFSDCVSRLDNLQTISTLEMRYLDQHEEEKVMKGLAHVKSLRCIIVKSNPVLATLNQLESLWVSYYGTRRRGEFSLPSTLKKLTIFDVSSALEKDFNYWDPTSQP